MIRSGVVRYGLPKRGLLRAACADQLGTEAPAPDTNMEDLETLKEFCSFVLHNALGHIGGMK